MPNSLVTTEFIGSFTWKESGSIDSFVEGQFCPKARIFDIKLTQLLIQTLLMLPKVWDEFARYSAKVSGTLYFDMK